MISHIGVPQMRGAFFVILSREFPRYRRRNRAQHKKRGASHVKRRRAIPSETSCARQILPFIILYPLLYYGRQGKPQEDKKGRQGRRGVAAAAASAGEFLRFKRERRRAIGLISQVQHCRDGVPSRGIGGIGKYAIFSKPISTKAASIPGLIFFTIPL